MTDIVIVFKKNIIQFLDELIEQFPMETDFILARIYINTRVSPEELIKSFIQKILPLKHYVDNRDEKFFLDGHITFLDTMDKSKVNHFKTLWKSSVLDQEDKNVMWKWFGVFMYLCEQYQQDMGKKTTL